MNTSERRNAHRFLMRLPLTVRCGQANGPSEMATETRDVSSRGVYFFVEQDLRAGSPVEILMTLPHEVTLAGPVKVRCLGRVHRTDPNAGRLGVVAVIERYEFLRGDDAAA
jgi:hypothetical protein